MDGKETSKDVMPYIPTDEELDDQAERLLKDWKNIEEGDGDIERYERWRKVFQFRKRGMSNAAIATILKISESTVKRDYQKYVYLRTEILKDQVTKNDLKDYADTLAELEFIKELAYGVQIASETDSPAQIASIKMLLDTIKEIIDLKKSVGIWGRVDEFGGMIEDSYEDRIKKLRQNKGLAIIPEVQEEEESLNVAGKMLHIEKEDEVKKLENAEKAKKEKEKQETPFLDMIQNDEDNPF